MLTAFVLDVLLVLVIEIKRKAIETVVDNAIHEPSAFVIFHATISLLVLVLYTAQTISGTKIAKGKVHLIPLHKKMSVVFIILRLINYVTSFQMADLV